jgi:hypothetical protein
MASVMHNWLSSSGAARSASPSRAVCASCVDVVVSGLDGCGGLDCASLCVAATETGHEGGLCGLSYHGVIVTTSECHGWCYLFGFGLFL